MGEGLALPALDDQELGEVAALVLTLVILVGVVIGEWFVAERSG